MAYTLDTFTISSPKRLIIFTAIRPVCGRKIGRDVQARTSTSGDRETPATAAVP